MENVMPGYEGHIVGEFDHHIVIEIEGRRFQVAKGVLTPMGRNSFRLSPDTPIEHVFPMKTETEELPAHVQIAPGFMERLRNHPDY